MKHELEVVKEVISYKGTKYGKEGRHESRKSKNRQEKNKKKLVFSHMNCICFLIRCILIFAIFFASCHRDALHGSPWFSRLVAFLENLGGGGWHMKTLKRTLYLYLNLMFFLRLEPIKCISSGGITYKSLPPLLLGTPLLQTRLTLRMGRRVCTHSDNVPIRVMTCPTRMVQAILCAPISRLSSELCAWNLERWKKRLQAFDWYIHRPVFIVIWYLFFN